MRVAVCELGYAVMQHRWPLGIVHTVFTGTGHWIQGVTDDFGDVVPMNIQTILQVSGRD